MLDRQRPLTESTADRIVRLLRRGPLTIDEVASAVGLTRTAVRAQLASLQQEGSVEYREMRRGTSKPARTYGLTAEAEQRLSKAYIPILTQLLHVLAGRQAPEEVDAIMHEVGRRLVAGRALRQGTLAERVLAGSVLLNELGGTTEVIQEDSHFVIRGHGCPIAVVTNEHPAACNTLESLLSEFIGESVVKCCDRYERRRCCFEVATGRNVQPLAVKARRRP